MPVTALFLIPRRINFGPFDWKYKLFYIRIGGLALLLLLQFVGRLNRNKSSKGRASRNMFTGLVLTVVNRAAFNDKRKTRRKENVSSTLPRNKTKKPMTNGAKSNFTSHCRITAKKLLRRTCCFPNPFRPCSLQFSDDWQISQLGWSWKAEKRKDQRLLLPAPPDCSIRRWITFTLCLQNKVHCKRFTNSYSAGTGFI